MQYNILAQILLFFGALLVFESAPIFRAPKISSHAGRALGHFDSYFLKRKKIKIAVFWGRGRPEKIFLFWKKSNKSAPMIKLAVVGLQAVFEVP